MSDWREQMAEKIRGSSSLTAGTRRAVDVFEADDLDEESFVELVRQAVALNTAG